MAEKNIKRREEILTTAYRLLGEKHYDHVSLSDIAKGAGINKSLLQHYYGQKIDIVKAMLTEMLETASSYMKQLPYEDEEIFQWISDFNMLFFKGAAANYSLRMFIRASVMHDECLDIWVDTICDWLRRHCGENTFTYLELKRAICFAMGGSMHLYLHQDELDIDYRRICRRHIWIILHFLHYEEEAIGKIIKTTDERIEGEDAQQYLQYCAENIPWLNL